MYIVSEDLLSYIDPMPIDRLILHDTQAVRSWLSTEGDQLLAVAHRYLHVARRNVTDITRYLDIHYAHLAAYVGAGDDSMPLMTVQTFPRLPGGVHAALDSPQ